MDEGFEEIEALYETDSSADTQVEDAQEHGAPKAVADNGPETGANAEARRRATFEAIIASGAVW